ncbi:alkaline phosphatase family protein [Salipaludibacillus daqingensis]|uniref:alkaline phosphatase family protein n=1 Tax=Salipaludibacillus daqingensis TaxID=3041001 RepID=UPI002474B02A|nr:alkaline phosphatase family protein [Salipaludibacillus daqingensis]
MKYVLILIILLSACQSDSHSIDPYKINQPSSQQKKVVMIMIDSMMSHSLDKSLEQGNVPALEYLINKGHYEKELVVPFPSMSVTVESTLITGTMPDMHQVPGLAWFKADENRLVNYGSNWTYWLNNGLYQGIYDVLSNLNNDHLNPEVSTVFEELYDRGQSSGSINTLLYRGNIDHQLKIFPIIDGLTDLPQTINTAGPETLAFGRFKKPHGLEEVQFNDGVFHRFGLMDKYSMEMTQQLVQKGLQPHFLLLFLPDNDKKTHKHGPDHLAGLEKADKYLQGILDSYGSWDKALDENVFIIFGDHGQDQLVEKHDDLAINLDSMYNDFQIADLGTPVNEGEIAFGVNQRMTYVYDLHHHHSLSSLAKLAMEDSRIDLAAWIENDWINVRSPDHEEELSFKRGGDWMDPYNQNWSLRGNTDVLDLTRSESNKKGISYNRFPDVLNHLETSLKSHETDKLILAAKPGHSFLSEGIATHEDGGEHGGLHKNDLLAAMVIAGTNKKPEFNRIVDLKEFVMELLEENEN